MDAGRRQFPVPGNIKLFIRINHIDHMMRNLLPQLGRWLRRANVHLAVDLLRVGVDDLAIYVRGKLQRNIAFAYGRGAKDNDQFRLHGKLETECLSSKFKVQRSRLMLRTSNRQL